MSPDIPAPTRCLPIFTSASKSGLRSGPQGVMRAGMVPEKTCDGILGLPKVGLSARADIRMSWPPVLDENAGWELKIRTIARAPNEGDPAAALAAALGRPF